MTLSSARNSIAAYAKTQSPQLGAICDRLQAEINKGIPNATSKIWHGIPVWFVDENPVVGYNVRQERVDLMFWSGQLFDEPLLKAVGKFKAARVSFQDAAEIDLSQLRRWLKTAGSIMFDYVGMYRRKRETSNSKSQKRA
jgi:hypothetical protein